MRAAVLASPKIDSLLAGRGDCELLRHGISLTATALTRNSTKQAANRSRDSIVLLSPVNLDLRSP